MKAPINVTKSFLPPLQEFTQKIESLWQSHWLTNNGVFHQELTEKLRLYLNCANVELFTNGHMALDIAIKALNLKGEVITTPFTFASTTHALVMNGITPVFCDIKGDDFTIDENLVESLITENTTGILPVHVYGFPCNNEVLQLIASKHGLKLLYDAAHAFGVHSTIEQPISSWGNASMFSFHATKVFHTIEGGAVSFNDSALRKPLQLLKNFGIASEEEVMEVGLNAKMNEFCAAMGLCNIEYLDANIESRKIIANYYLSRLQNIPGIGFLPFSNLEEKGFLSNYAYFPIVIDEKILGISRDSLYEKLKKFNVFARKYFFPLVTDMECYTFLQAKGNTPVASRIA